MKRTRILALTLAVLMLAGIFAACAGTEPETTTTEATTTEATTTEATTTEATTTEATTTEATTTEATTAEPKLDLGGRELTIVDRSSGTMYIYPDDPEGNESDANFKAAWDAVQDEYNFVLSMPGGLKLDAVLTNIYAGDTDANGDIYMCKPLEWVTLALNGYLAALNSDQIKATGFDVYDPAAFHQDFTQAMQIYNKIFACQWAGDYSVVSFGWCVYFNIDYVDQYGGESDLFQVVRDMKWDWEKFMDLQQKCAKDLDGDGVYDIWGSGEHSYGQEIYTIPGGAIVYLDEETGKYMSGLTLPETEEALQFAQNYFNSGYCETSTGYGKIHAMFNQGMVALQWGEKFNTTSQSAGFRESTIRYGLVPLPKHPDAETYVNVLGGVPGCTLFAANSHFEENAQILYALGKTFTSDGWKDNYCEVELQGNEDSLDMVCNYIWGEHGTSVFDLIWGEKETLLNTFRNDTYFPIVTGNGSIAEICEAQNAIIQGNLDALFHQQ